MSDKAEDILPMWTIYDHPTDYPTKFVARKFVVKRSGLSEATQDVITTETIDELRSYFDRQGLYALPRSHFDDPCIVETWI